jgi:hypothetical protein
MEKNYKIDEESSKTILIPILYEAALNRPQSGRLGLSKQSPSARAELGTSL